MQSFVDVRRSRSLNGKPIKRGPIIYWLSREQRTNNNWSLLFAQELALKSQQPLLVIFTLSDSFLGATWRQYDFMLRGLQEVEAGLRQHNIPMILLSGDPVRQLATFVKAQAAGAVVCDFDPLRIKREWRRQLAEQASCAVIDVDAHNIVPVWLASDKAEFGAYTIRPKIKRLLSEFLQPFPRLRKQAVKTNFSRIDWRAARRRLKLDESVAPRQWLEPGEQAALQAGHSFIQHKLAAYSEQRNDPNLRAQSYLSPYLHFGQLSAQDLAWQLRANPRAEDFLEELVVRKELSDNFCYYQENYDTPDAFPNWAKETVKKHAQDKRDYLYSRGELEGSLTHDELWNAAQRELVQQGTMPGYLRMYWAKKILEWTASAAEAQEQAIYLNDRYQLDGRDPNGYTGIAWSIGGVHDRAWAEREVFGKIRYMNYQGCRRKFDVDKYIKSHQ